MKRNQHVNIALMKKKQEDAEIHEHDNLTIPQIKEKIKEAILDGDIKNDFDEAFNLMLRIGKSMGLEK